MQGYVEAERLRGLEIAHQLERGGLHHRQFGRLGAMENLGGGGADLAIRGRNAWSVANQAAGQWKFAPCVHDGERMARCQREDLIAPAREKDIAIGEECPT